MAVKPQLWRELPRDERRRQSARFGQLAPDEVASLELGDLVLLCQWLLEWEKVRAVDLQEHNGGWALELRNVQQDWNEFLVIYDRLPTNALYKFLEVMQGREYKRMRMWIRSPIPAAAQELKSQYPLVLEFLEQDGLERKLMDLQRRVHEGPSAAFRHLRPKPLEIFPRKWTPARPAPRWPAFEVPAWLKANVYTVILFLLGLALILAGFIKAMWH